MAYQGNTVLAVVPARGGSKGIPKKNLAKVAGVSLVGRTGDLLSTLEWVDCKILSTDSEEIGAEGGAHGLETPFLRPKELSSDLANSADMWRHAWHAAEEHFGSRFDVSILLEPTSPMRRPDDIVATVQGLIAGEHVSAATVSPAPAHFTPHKCLTVHAGRIGFYHADGAHHSIRQTIPDYFFRNGICYALSRNWLDLDEPIIGNDCLAIVVDRPVVNIDEPFDLELAEFLLRRGY